MIGINLKNGFLQGDLVIWVVLFLLCMISIIEVYSASSNMTYSPDKAYWAPVLQHGLLVCLALAVAWGMHAMSIGMVRLTLLTGYLAALVMLVMVLASNNRVNNAARWIEFAGITIQPSEIAKLTLVGTVAFALARGWDKKTQRTGKTAFKWVVGFTVVTCGLIFTENFSTAGIIALVMVMLTWMANPPKKMFYGICLSLVSLASVVLITVKNLPDTALDWMDRNVSGRATTWVNRLRASNDLPPDPKEYPIHENVQVTHARIAVATSGFLGLGPGKSVERDFLPQAYSDFIYAIIIEEGGLLSGGVVMALYLLLLYRSMRIARRCKNRFPAYLTMGLSLMLVTQAFVNMAVAVGAMPVTGQPLPLVSKGGTSMFITNAYIGIILCVSRNAKQIEKEEDLEKQQLT